MRPHHCKLGHSNNNISSKFFNANSKKCFTISYPHINKQSNYFSQKPNSTFLISFLFFLLRHLPTPFIISACVTIAAAIFSDVRHANSFVNNFSSSAIRAQRPDTTDTYLWNERNNRVNGVSRRIFWSKHARADNQKRLMKCLFEVGNTK